MKLSRNELLAAGLFGYSLDNYADHVEVENERFTKLMPRDISILLRAESEKWNKQKIAESLEIEENQVDSYMEHLDAAKIIVDDVNPSESFRYSVKHSIKTALHDGLKTEEDIDQLVIQICYNAADFGFLLKQEGKEISDYSEW